MLNKIKDLLIHLVFPQTHLETYLASCSYMEFIQRHTIRHVQKEHIFAPFYYKDPFVKDCIIELKERNNMNVARLYAPLLAGWIQNQITHICEKNPLSKIYLIPTPQHISKTKDKNFCHTHTLVEHIFLHTYMQHNLLSTSISYSIQKIHNTKRLHDLSDKRTRFKTIAYTMKAFITKKDIVNGYFFCIDDVYTSGATFKEMRRSLLDCGAFPYQIYFVSIAH